MKNIIYVLPVPDGWAVKADGVQKPISVHHRKEDAEERGIAEARMHEALLYIRDDKGKDVLKNDFSNLPAL
jgi:hypothetical protein